MKLKRKRRPLSVSLLAIAMISLSIWTIAMRVHLLSSIHAVSADIANITGELIFNIDLLSSISALAFGFVPLTLGIGLWYLLHWARVLSICMFASVLLPSLMVVIGWVADANATPEFNLLVSIGCAIALSILLNPKVSLAFTRYRQSS